METPESFEQHMAQIIWDNRWKTPHALQIWVENYMDRPATLWQGGGYCA